MRVGVYVLSAKWGISFQRQCDLSASGKDMGQELFLGCQEAILDLRKDQSFNHLMLLIWGDCFNLCYELSARDGSLRWKVFAHLALPHMWGGQHLLEAVA